MQLLGIQTHSQLASKFESLMTLNDGWLDGQGLAPDKNQLAGVAEKFLEFYPETLALPFIAPTPEGNLLLEWDILGSPSVDLELSSLSAEFHAFQPDGSDLERDFSLKTKEDWKEFFAFLHSNLRPSAQ